MTLYNDWKEAEATIEYGDRMITVRCPSKIALTGALSHLAPENNHLFLRNAERARPIKYIVDVGANVGATALILHRAFPDARVLAIEPMEINYKCLLYNIRDFPQITPLKMAVSNRREVLRISMPTLKQRPDLNARFGNAGLFSVYGKDMEHSEVVQADTLDNIVDGRVDFLKIDVEGSEGLVLAGANHIMLEDRPTVLIEMRDTNIAMSGHTIEEYNRYFKAIRYREVGGYVGDTVLCPSEHKEFEWEMP